MNEGKMFNAALGSLLNVIRVSSGDKILTLFDLHSQGIAEAFIQAARSLKCETSSYLIKEDERPLTDIPTELAELLKGKTIVLNILKAFPEEINFRIKWLFMIEGGKKAKCAHMPGITEAMMTEGPMNVDYEEMRRNAFGLINALNNADHLHITTKAGTDITLGINKRIFTDDIFVKPGGMCNLPCGEIYCAPEETKAEGLIVFDGSIGDIGMLKSRLKAHLNHGRIIRFESEDQSLVEKITELSSIDDDAMVIGELGIGINPGARITGNMLEDEKAIHTAHFAFGNNEDFPGGGMNRSKIHRDYLFYRPTIEIFYQDRPSIVIIEEGEFRI
jgi:leucyl aminopeptidase (aminopeptidase T)